MYMYKEHYHLLYIRAICLVVSIDRKKEIIWWYVMVSDLSSLRSNVFLFKNEFIIDIVSTKVHHSQGTKLPSTTR